MGVNVLREGNTERWEGRTEFSICLLSWKKKLQCLETQSSDVMFLMVQEKWGIASKWIIELQCCSYKYPKTDSDWHRQVNYYLILQEAKKSSSLFWWLVNFCVLGDLGFIHACWKHDGHRSSRCYIQMAASRGGREVVSALSPCFRMEEVFLSSLSTDFSWSFIGRRIGSHTHL
jgi:hypothetical protein